MDYSEFHPAYHYPRTSTPIPNIQPEELTLGLAPMSEYSLDFGTESVLPTGFDGSLNATEDLTRGFPINPLLQYQYPRTSTPIPTIQPEDFSLGIMPLSEFSLDFGTESDMLNIPMQTSQIPEESVSSISTSPSMQQGIVPLSEQRVSNISASPSMQQGVIPLPERSLDIGTPSDALQIPVQTSQITEQHVSRISATPGMQQYSVSRTKTGSFDAALSASLQKANEISYSTLEGSFDSRLGGGLFAERFPRQPYDSTLRAGIYPPLEHDDTLEYIKAMDPVALQRELKDYEFMVREINKILTDFHAEFEESYCEIQTPEELLKAIQYVIDDLIGIAEQKKNEAKIPDFQYRKRRDKPFDPILMIECEANFNDSLVVERSDMLELKEEAYEINKKMEGLALEISLLYATHVPAYIPNEITKRIVDLQAQLEAAMKLNLSLEDKIINEDTKYWNFVNVNFIAYASLSGARDEFMFQDEEFVISRIARHVIDVALSYFPETMVPTIDDAREIFNLWKEWMFDTSRDTDNIFQKLGEQHARVKAKNDDLRWSNQEYEAKYMRPLYRKLRALQDLDKEEGKKNVQRLKNKTFFINEIARHKVSIETFEIKFEIASKYYVGFAEMWAELKEYFQDSRLQLGIPEPQILFQTYEDVGTSP